ncbi:arsenic resistance N-acetyltransferase ArsN2 [Mucilaginibacter sp. McL0603]|uniref:arsenic resistance N-acetyltransferase ArsN2 n=1 Tax=Mucilaginibacter sp. McL0603 TaxID=3415670 RepID=UPI003CF3E659
MEIKEATNYRQSITSLLSSEKLPVDDLPASLDNFIVAIQNYDVIGAAGLEVYGDYGLLRSLAVSPALRGQGIANELLQQIETLAGSKGLKSIFLLTETAPEYFDRKNYTKITRADVPAEVQQSSEFSYACPQTAIVMKKTLST